MSHRRAFWAAIALCLTTLFPVFAINGMNDDVGALAIFYAGLMLAINVADQLIGRALYPRDRWLLDVLVAFPLVGALFVAWINFFAVDGRHTAMGWAIISLPILGAITLPILRFLGEGRMPIVYWTAVAVLTGVTSAALAWGGIATIYDGYAYAYYDPYAYVPDSTGINTVGPALATLTASGLWVVFICIMLYFRLTRHAARVRPRRWLGTMFAGALIGFVHAAAWAIVYRRMIQNAYYVDYTPAFDGAVFSTWMLGFALAPNAISRLMGASATVREQWAVIDDDLDEPTPLAKNLAV